jgi:2-dehydro-3-deoxyphosphogluconate aldolase/(4S)-4-hydroxy-2-oxoglutarate aldolase
LDSTYTNLKAGFCSKEGKVARYRRHQVINAIYEIGLVPIFYHKDLETAKNIVRACAAGGARVVEFTNRGEFAYQIFGGMVRYFETEAPDVILGVGSVIDAPTAALYINGGANFVVGPVFNPEVARLCNRRKVCYVPGCGSVSEISDAEEMGAEIIKVFPGGQVGGPAFIKAVLAPMPWTSMMPTAGIEPTRESVKSWIDAGAVCLGMASKLISKEIVASGKWQELTKKVEACLKLIRESRASGGQNGRQTVLEPNFNCTIRDRV